MKYVFIWLLLINLALFFTMGSDKHRAKTGKRRVPEASLFLLAFLGGALGGSLGMYAFRHSLTDIIRTRFAGRIFAPAFISFFAGRQPSGIIQFRLTQKFSPAKSAISECV